MARCGDDSATIDRAADLEELRALKARDVRTVGGWKIAEMRISGLHRDFFLNSDA